MAVVTGEAAKVYSEETGLPLVKLDSQSAPVEYSLLRSRMKNPSGELLMVLDASSNDYKFSVTNEEFISVLSVVDSGDALKLLSAGLRSSEQVSEFLRLEGLESLQRDYSRLGTAALESGMSPLHLMEFLNATDSSLKERLPAVDAVRTFALEKKEKPDLWYHGSIAQSVVHGEARYEDIVAIGASLARRHFDLEEFTARLSELAQSRRQLEFNALHLRKVIELRMESGMDPDAAEARLLIMSQYGGDFALAIKNPVKIRRALYALPFGDARGIIKYADSIYSEFSDDDDPKISDIIVLHTHGIPVEVAVPRLKEGRSGRQTIAMISGVETALTEGWL